MNAAELQKIGANLFEPTSWKGRLASALRIDRRTVSRWIKADAVPAWAVDELSRIVAEASMEIPPALRELPFAIKHDPNDVMPWQVRLARDGNAIDYKPHSGSGDITTDVLGFGKTLAEAAKAVLENKTTIDKGFSGS